MRYLRQSTAATVTVGPFLSTADAVTPVTSLTAASTLGGRAVSNGTGATFAPATFAHDAGGDYLVALAAGDVPSAGRLRVSFRDPATFLPVWEDFTVLSAAVYDVLFGTVAPSTHNAAAVQALVAAGAVASVTGAVGSVTSPVTVGTNNDKTGYALAVAPPTAAAIADAVWDEPRTGHVSAATFGSYLDAAISGVAAGGGLSAGEVTAAVWNAPFLSDYSDETMGVAMGNALRGYHRTLAPGGHDAPGSVPEGTVGLVLAEAVDINLAQTGYTPRALDTVADSALTTGDLLVAGYVGAVGDQAIVGTAYTKKTAATNTTVCTKTLDSATSPTSLT